MIVAMAMVVAILTILPAAQAQTFTVLHDFVGPEGIDPSAGLTMDGAGNLYGTAAFGGPITTNCPYGCGTVFKLSRKNGAWLVNVLYAFTGFDDGRIPSSRVIIGPDGNLYGTTEMGGSGGSGVVYRLQPPPTLCRAYPCPWRQTVLHAFAGDDGQLPGTGDLTFDRAGNVYGTTVVGGAHGAGTVYELTPGNGGWTETVLYSFAGGIDGEEPYAGVILDQQGNLYGTTVFGGDPNEIAGTVYKLSRSGSGWSKTTLYDFPSFFDGGFPYGGLISDQAGNLYGTTSKYGFQNGGTVYELTRSNGMHFQVLFNLTSQVGSYSTLYMDAAGNLYGTLTQADTEVFRLTKTSGSWNQTGFAGQAGNSPAGSVIMDASGNLYTTASEGGAHGNGVVFGITP